MIRFVVPEWMLGVASIVVGTYLGLLICYSIGEGLSLGKAFRNSIVVLPKIFLFLIGMTLLFGGVLLGIEFFFHWETGRW